MIDSISTKRRSRRLTNTQTLAGRGLALVCGTVLLAGVLGAAVSDPQENQRAYLGSVVLPAVPDLAAHVDSLLAALRETRPEVERARFVVEHAARFNVSAELAAMIYDAASEVSIDPRIGFRLVNVESRFDPNAHSHAGAIGLAQVLLSTARFFDPQATPDALRDPQYNLRIGFRHLSNLLAAFDGDLRLALLAYNRGPTRTRQLLQQGLDPANGYAKKVLD